jgi:hypothetical protein
MIVYKITNVIDKDYYIGYTKQTDNFLGNDCYGSGMKHIERIFNFIIKLTSQLNNKDIIDEMYDLICSHPYNKNKLNITPYLNDVSKKEQIINILNYIKSTDFRKIGGELLVLLSSYSIILFKKEILFESEHLDEIKKAKKEFIQIHADKDPKHCMSPFAIKKDKFSPHQRIEFGKYISNNYEKYQDKQLKEIRQIFLIKYFKK